MTLVPEDLSYSEEHEWVRVEDDVAIVGVLGLADQHGVAIEDAGVDHRIAADLEREMLARRQQFGGHVDHVGPRLDRLDRRTGGDASHDRHGDRPSALVFGSGADPAEIGGGGAVRLGGLWTRPGEGSIPSTSTFTAQTSTVLLALLGLDKPNIN